MKIMEKKKYNKPEVVNTKLDLSINLVLMSPNAVVTTPNPPDPNDETTVVITNNPFINPFKWFR
jgi:hypothetical protein